MKKQKLHQFAKFAALSIVGAMPAMATGDAYAQQTQKTLMPPIVQGSQSARLPAANSSYSYTRDAAKPVTPMFAMDKSNVPPIISSKTASSTKDFKLETAGTGTGLLSPIGSGVVKQVAGRLEPGQPRIARAFSPAKMPVAQGSGTRSIPAPAVQIPAPAVQIPAPPVISGSLVSPRVPNTAPRSILQNAPITAPSYFDAAPVTNPIPTPSVVAGCNDCGTAGGGGCNSCGPGGCYNPDQINCDYGTYGSVSAARRYAYLEYLYLTREDGDVNNSNFNPLGQFDFSSGWRFTLGQRSDMTQGREFSYFGTEGIDATQTTVDPDGDLNALFFAAGGLETADLSSFFGATEQTQFKETTIHSFEFNRVRWGWDVLKSFVGFRYIYFDDEFQLDSTAPEVGAFGAPTGLTTSGTQRIDTINHLLGAHIGAELFYDIGYRFSLSGMSKYGVYVNVNEVDNFLVNDGTVLLDTENNDAGISTTWEINLLAHYQIRQSARLRVGYNGLFVGNVATVEENFQPFVSPFTGFDSSDEDDAFIHGFTFGLEIYR